MKYHIQEIKENDREEVVSFIIENWVSSKIITRGQTHDTKTLNGFLIRDHEKIIGLLTYHINNENCEIVSLDSKIENHGLGSKLINKLIKRAKEMNCSRVWLITTNDNIRAIRFYQKRSFDIAAIHINAIEESRKIKPEIPLLGNDDIPIKHEIEFELILEENRS